MPSNVTNLDDLVGGDHEFVYLGEKYLIPGDPSTESVFEFLKLYDDLLEAQTKASEDGGISGARADVEKLILGIKAKLLVLFKERQPGMTELPFGHNGTMLVLRTVLGLLGVTVNEDTPADPPVPAKPKAAPRRATSVKKAPAKRSSTRSAR